MTLLFYVLCLVITGGIPWVWVGIVYSRAAHRGINSGLIQLYGSIAGTVFNAAVFLMINRLHPMAADLPVSTVVWAAVSQAGAGAINFLMLRAMTVAMARGPHGITWSIMQSGMILPFLMGILVFGVKLRLGMAIGIVLILASILLFGVAKQDGKRSNVASERAWFGMALLAFLFCGVTHCCGNLASYLPRGAEVGSVFRCLFAALGSAIVWPVFAWMDRKKTGKPLFRGAPHRQIAKYALSILVVGIPSQYFLFYRGLDGLQRLGYGAVGYPIAVCSCIAGFFLYCTLIRRERPNRIQTIGMLAAMLGVLVICL